MKKQFLALTVAVALLVPAGALQGCSSASTEEAADDLTERDSLLTYATLFGSPRSLRNVSMDQSPLRKQEAERAQAFLSEGPAPAEAIKARVAELAPKPAPATVAPSTVGVLAPRDGSLFFTAPGGSERKVVDAAELAPRKLGKTLLSRDGKYVAYASAIHGSGAEVWQVRSLEAESPKDLLEKGLNIFQEDISWDSESKGLYYTLWADPAKTPVAAEHVTVHYLSLEHGDRVIFTPPEPEAYAIAELDGGKTILAHRVNATYVGIDHDQAIYLGQRIADGSYQWKSLGERNQFIGHFVGKLGNQIFVRTNRLGNAFGIESYDWTRPEARPSVIVEARPDYVLDRVQLLQGKLIISYFKQNTFEWKFDVRDAVSKALEKSFTMRDLGLTPVGTITPFAAGEGTKVSMTFSSYNLPDTRIQYDIATKTPSVIAGTELNFDGSEIKYELTEVRSKDGEEIPLMVFTRNGMQPNGATLFYYGAIGLNQFPSWDRLLQTTLEQGGAFVIALIRGGGEKGASWYTSGAPRTHVTDDIGAAAGYINQRWGIKPIATGRSFGGLHTFMVAASEYKDRFSGFQPVVGFLSLSRSEKTILQRTLLVSDFQMPRDQAGNADFGAWDSMKEVIEPKTQNFDRSKPILSLTMQGDAVVQPNLIHYPIWDALRERSPDAPFYGLEKPAVGHGARVYHVDQAQFYGRVFNTSTFSPMKR